MFKVTRKKSYKRDLVNAKMKDDDAFFLTGTGLERVEVVGPDLD